MTVAKIRTKYWIVQAHDLVKSVKFQYVVCREIGAKVESKVPGVCGLLCLSYRGTCVTFHINCKLH